MSELLHKTTLVGKKLIDLYAVAVAQRQLILLIAASLLVQAAYLVLPRVLGGMNTDLMMVFSAVFGLAHLMIFVLSIVLCARLARRTGAGAVFLVLTVLIMLLPCLNLLWLLMVNGRATRHIQAAGVRVGFFGVARDDLAALLEGACAGCGYDIRGVTAAQCPECGRVIERPQVAGR